MKSFFTKLLLFLLPLLLIALPLDHFLSKRLTKSESYMEGEYTVWNDIYNGVINTDIAIYGASRAMVHFDPVIIENSLHRSCYNFGINGLQFYHIYLRHLEYLKYNEPPKFIILSCDNASFGKGQNLFNEDQFLPYMLGNSNMRKYLDSVNSFSFSDFYLPMIRYHGRRNAILHALGKRSEEEEYIPPREKGYIGMERDWNTDFDIAKDQLGTYYITIDSLSIQLFNKFLAECKANNIEVLFIYSPEYIDGQLFVENRDDIIKIYEDYSLKYDLKFIDYSDDEMSFNKDYFYNTTHMNKHGAELFTQKLCKDIETNINGIEK